MFTAILILAMVVLFATAVFAIVGGVSLFFDGKGSKYDTLDLWLFYQMISGGAQILVSIIPAIIEAIADANK